MVASRSFRDTETALAENEALPVEVATSSASCTGAKASILRGIFALLFIALCVAGSALDAGWPNGPIVCIAVMLGGVVMALPVILLETRCKVGGRRNDHD